MQCTQIWYEVARLAYSDATCEMPRQPTLAKFGYRKIIETQSSQRDVSFPNARTETSMTSWRGGGGGRVTATYENGWFTDTIESTTSRKLTELIKGWFPYDRRRSQKVLRSSAVILETHFCDIVCDPSWSQTIAEDRTMFCLSRSPAFIWKPKFCNLRSKRIP